MQRDASGTQVAAPVLDLVPGPAVLLDGAGNLVGWNAACELVGPPRMAEMRGRPFPLSRPLDAMDAAETCWTDAQGRERIFSWNAGKMPGDSGTIILTGFEITAYRQREQQLRWDAQVRQIMAELSAACAAGQPLMEISRMVLAAALRATGARYGVIGHREGAGEQFVFPATELPSRAQNLEQCENLCAWLAENRQEAYFADSGPGQFNQLLAVPAAAGGIVLGQIAVAGSAREYGSEQRLLLRRLADLYALTIQRHRAEEALRDANSRFGATFRGAPLGIAVFGALGKIQMWNPAAEAMFGWHEAEAVGHFLPLIPESDLRSAPELCWREQPGILEQQRRRKDGSLLDVAIYTAPLWNENGESAGVLAMWADVSERRRTEAALRESEDRFRAIFENAAIGILISDLQGRPIEANPAVCNMLGYAQDELRAMYFAEFTHLEDLRMNVKLHQELMTGKRDHYQVGNRYVRKDGTVIWGRLTASLVRDGQGRPDFLIGMIEDVTEQKQAEEALRKTVEELARSNAELEHFAYVASHDLQEPLRMVTSFVQLLRRRYKGQLDQDADEFITFAVEGASRMKTLIDDLLTYSRVGTRAKPFKETDTQAVVEQALANLAVAAEESGATVIRGELPVVMADAGQLVQLFQNLLSNALKFRGEEPLLIEVGAERGGEAWVFHVRDNGIGIPTQYHEAVFEIFKRLHTKNEFPGSGIGLTVCRKIVERHGGRIWVESTPSHGSKFRFTIPDFRKASES